MTSLKENISSFDNKKIKEINLDKSIFGIEVNEDIIHRMVRYQLAKKEVVITKQRVSQRYLGQQKNHLSKKEQEALAKVAKGLHKCAEVP